MSEPKPIPIDLPDGAECHWSNLFEPPDQGDAQEDVAWILLRGGYGIDVGWLPRFGEMAGEYEILVVHPRLEAEYGLDPFHYPYARARTEDAREAARIVGELARKFLGLTCEEGVAMDEAILKRHAVQLKAARLCPPFGPCPRFARPARQ